MNEDLYTTGYGIQEGGKGLYLNLCLATADDSRYFYIIFVGNLLTQI